MPRNVTFKVTSFCTIEVPDEISDEKLIWWANYGFFGKSPLTCTTIGKMDELPPIYSTPWQIMEP